MPEAMTPAERLETRRHALAARAAAAATHDLNNLLGRMIGLAEMVMDDLPDRPDARAELETLIVTAEQAAGLVRRLDACADAAAATPHRFDLQATLDAACDAAAGSGAALARHEDPCPPCLVFADEDLVRVAFDAAMQDAARRGADRIEAGCRLLPSGQEAEILLCDDGAAPAGEGLAGAAMAEAGGRLEAESRPGATTVRLILPTC